MARSTMAARRSARAAALAVVAALTLSACSGDDPDPQQPTPAVEQSEAAAGESTDGPQESDPVTDPEEARSAAETGVDITGLGEPFESFEIGAEGIDGGTMKIDIYPLQRDGDIVTLVAGLTLQAEPHQASPLQVLLGGGAINPVLVDAKNLRRHRVVQAERSPLKSDTLITRISGGQTRYWYGVYAAPPEDVTSMTVLFDGVPAVAEVPIR